jgi:metal-responsive CopG/Arc/MetJ family transcriptional regulator
MFDEQLLARLDATDEVRQHGRSAILRRAVEEYLRRGRRFAIAESYRQAYGTGQEMDDLAGWEDQGEWLDE